MSLIDTTDSVLMIGAYGWAFVKPIRRLYYNIVITSVSVVVALAVGAVETLGLLAGRLHLQGSFWSFVDRLNSHFGVLGYLILALFAISWIGALAVYKWRGIDRMGSTESAGTI